MHVGSHGRELGRVTARVDFPGLPQDDERLRASPLHDFKRAATSSEDFVLAPVNARESDTYGRAALLFRPEETSRGVNDSAEQ